MLKRFGKMHFGKETPDLKMFDSMLLGYKMLDKKAFCKIYC